MARKKPTLCSPARIRTLATRAEKLSEDLKTCAPAGRTKRQAKSPSQRVRVKVVPKAMDFSDMFAPVRALSSGRQGRSVDDLRSMFAPSPSPSQRSPFGPVVVRVVDVREIEPSSAGRHEIEIERWERERAVAGSQRARNNATRQINRHVAALGLGSPAKPIGGKKMRNREPAPSTRTGRVRGRLDVAAVESTVEHLERDALAVPQPIGPTVYRPAQCATGRDPWGTDYESALEEARERAAIEAGDDDEEFRRLLRRYFSEHPRFTEWSRVERECVADFRRKHAKRGRRTATASSETKRVLEDASRDLGYDVTGSAEHLDRLSLSGQAAYWRRLHKKTGSLDALRRAREIEKRARARKRKGAGVTTFAVV